MFDKHCEFDWCYDLSRLGELQSTPEGHLQCVVPFAGTYGVLTEEICEAFDNSLDYLAYSGEEFDVITKLDGIFDLYTLVIDYVHFIARELEIPSLKFLALSMPKEYNFCTDTLICSISKEDAWKLYTNRDKKLYDILVKEGTTSRSGFIPFYNERDFYFDTLEDLPENYAALLTPLLETACREICSDKDQPDYDTLDCSYDLYLDFIDGSDVMEYMEFTPTYKSDSSESEASA